MKRRAPLHALAAALAAAAAGALLLASFAIVGSPAGLAAAGACTFAWLLVQRLAVLGATACLAATLVLGVVSVLAGAPGFLAVAASAAGLAAWDLSLAHAAAVTGTGEERRLLRARLLALAAGILPGLLLPALLWRVRLGLPFPLMLLLAGGALLALHQLGRPSTSRSSQAKTATLRMSGR